jgi:hypothetical protein
MGMVIAVMVMVMVMVIVPMIIVMMVMVMDEVLTVDLCLTGGTSANCTH